MASGFAVIDFETTGVRAEGGDRIVEIAVVHLDPEGRFEGAYETLVNPGRDLGPQRIHGISARDVLDAPGFESVAADFIDLLGGRVVVAHNASFERRFIRAELLRMGASADGLSAEAEHFLCTMRLAREYLPGSGRSLSDCCAAYDIELVGAHRASVDAHATGLLLEQYMTGPGDRSRWDAALAAGRSASWPVVPRRRTRWAPRPATDARPEPFLSRMVSRLPDISGPAEHLDYLALLDRCLLDREISAHEEEALVSLADDLGIGRDTAALLHDRYFDGLVAAAWADGVLSDDELDDLVAVAMLLNIDETTIAETTIAEATIQPIVSTGDEQAAMPVFSLQQGDLVVLTGEMTRSREEWSEELRSRGFVPHTCVNRKVKLVVAADPDTLSGKARKARDYDITIVSEAGLAALLSR